VDSGDIVTVDNVAPNLTHFTRTPPETIELVWRPGIADTEFNDPTAAASATIRDRKNAMTAVWAGLPAGTGLTFHFTAVYEWLPKQSVGLSANVTGKNTSSNTFDDVLDYVNSTGFAWVRGLSHTVGTGLGAGMITGIAQTFGIMPAYGRARARIQMR
jgi:hypothetical protein